MRGQANKDLCNTNQLLIWRMTKNSSSFVIFPIWFLSNCRHVLTISCSPIFFLIFNSMVKSLRSLSFYPPSIQPFPFLSYLFISFTTAPLISSSLQLIPLLNIQILLPAQFHYQIFNILFWMVKHNNVIPGVHLRKHWQNNVKVWLNQAARKKRRLQARRAKAATSAPRPLEHLRPAVRCQTIRYNHRLRMGKGFTLAEIKAAGLGVRFARSIGIAVDHRRKNRNQESLELNKARLQNYINKLVLYPRNDKHPVTKAKTGILNDTPKQNQMVNNSAKVNVLPPLVKRVKAVSQIQLDQLKKGNAYRTLRQEWANQRNEGRRLKREKEAAEKN